ncbi:MAG TPA: hypothetical protein VJB12_01635 [Candidatus Nanoarchaeia archaeon]|nr:hypothetical protein [Candidatus Nanoarchaeia archaeon]
MAVLEIVLGFLASLIISAVVIYIAAKLLGEQEGFGTATAAALIGALIFAAASYIIGTGWIAALAAGIAWLIALGNLYSIGWFKSLAIAVAIWVLATIVSVVLPTLTGPL